MNTLQKDKLQGWRVLVVEDEVRTSLLLQELLTELGCKVVGVAMLLEDAVDLASIIPFDVAILDIGLNGELAFPAAEVVKQRGKKFVFLTGHAVEDLPASLGDAPFLQKPLNLSEMRMALSVLAERPEKHAVH